jgi:SAM-dependent methyltransferase
MYRFKKMASFAHGKILDIGCSQLPNIYLVGEVYGYDQCAVSLPSNYKGFIQGDAEDLIELNERYDTVVAGEIIEHLDDPIQFLKGCHHILNPGGKLVLSTPNPYHPVVVMLERFMIRRFFYSADHVYIFLPRFLVRLMEREGFSRVKVLSGGMALIKITIPFPRGWCYALIYVGEKL